MRKCCLNCQNTEVDKGENVTSGLWTEFKASNQVILKLIIMQMTFKHLEEETSFTNKNEICIKFTKVPSHILSYLIFLTHTEPCEIGEVDLCPLQNLCSHHAPFKILGIWGSDSLTCLA